MLILSRPQYLYITHRVTIKSNNVPNDSFPQWSCCLGRICADQRYDCRPLLWSHIRCYPMESYIPSEYPVQQETHTRPESNPPQEEDRNKIETLFNQTAHGYLCTKATWSVTCSEGFFGGRTLTHKIHPTLPTVSECVEAVRLYPTNHNAGLGFPVENCGWMGVNT